MIATNTLKYFLIISGLTSFQNIKNKAEQLWRLMGNPMIMGQLCIIKCAQERKMDYLAFEYFGVIMRTLLVMRELQAV